MFKIYLVCGIMLEHYDSLITIPRCVLYLFKCEETVRGNKTVEGERAYGKGNAGWNRKKIFCNREFNSYFWIHTLKVKEKNTNTQQQQHKNTCTQTTKWNAIFEGMCLKTKCEQLKVHDLGII